MNTHAEFIKNIIIRFIFTYLGCILIAFLFYQYKIFDIKTPEFDFVHYGALAAIFFTLLQVTSNRNALAAYVVLCIASQAILPKPYELSFSLFWNVIEHIILGVAIYLFWRFSYSKNRAVSLQPLLLAGYFIIFWILMSVALRGYTNWYSGFLHIIYYDIRFGFLFGIGMGFGIGAGDLLLEQKVTSVTSV